MKKIFKNICWGMLPIGTGAGILGGAFCFIHAWIEYPAHPITIGASIFVTLFAAHYIGKEVRENNA